MIIEVDGSSHFGKGEYDARRQKQLEELGCVFPRFSEGEVMQRYDYVQTQIEQAIVSLRKQAKECPPPAPPLKGEFDPTKFIGK